MAAVRLARVFARPLSQGPTLKSFEQRTLDEVNRKMRTDQASEPAHPPADRWEDADAGADEAAAGTESETGGPRGLEPTRYGDWERKGRCTDF
jgi:hypothetical protein